MAGIVLAPESLEELDRIDHDLLVMTVFGDEKPLRGLNGLVDWRTAGRISRMIMSNNLEGSFGERILTNPGSKLRSARVLVFGLGNRAKFDNMAFVKAVDEIFSLIDKMDAESILINIPGSDKEKEYILERMAILVKAIKTSFKKKVTVLISPNHDFKDIRAKFDLIEGEVEKVIQEVRHVNIT